MASRYVRFASIAVAVGLAACAGSEGDPKAPARGLVGNPAPDFQLKTVKGTRGTLTLGGLRGRVVLLDFWGTFCDPCRKSFPKLQALSERYAADGLEVVGVSEDEEDDKDKIPAFAEGYGAKFALGWDADKSIARRYEPETMPSSFLIDRAGVVRFVHVGFHDGEEVELDREIRQLLGR